MTLVEEIQATVEKLPPHLRLKVLDYSETLKRAADAERRTPRRSLMGALEYLNVKITAEDIDEARREMWGEWMEPRK